MKTTITLICPECHVAIDWRKDMPAHESIECPRCERAIPRLHWGEVESAAGTGSDGAHLARPLDQALLWQLKTAHDEAERGMIANAYYHAGRAVQVSEQIIRHRHANSPNAEVGRSLPLKRYEQTQEPTGGC